MILRITLVDLNCDAQKRGARFLVGKRKSTSFPRAITAGRPLSDYADIDVVDFLDPDKFVQAVIPSTSQIENLSSLLIDGTKSSLQWRSEEEQGASARSNR